MKTTPTKTWGNWAGLGLVLLALTACEQIADAPGGFQTGGIVGDIPQGESTVNPPDYRDAGAASESADAGGRNLSPNELSQQVDLIDPEDRALEGTEVQGADDTPQEWAATTNLQGLPAEWFAPDSDPERPPSSSAMVIPAEPFNFEDDLFPLIAIIRGRVKFPQPAPDSKEARESGTREIRTPSRRGYWRTIKLGQPLFVPKGQRLDGIKVSNGKYTRYVGIASKMGDGGQSENQKPLIVVEGGARVKNLIVDKPAADGIRVVLRGNQPTTTYIENVDFRDVGEDAITVKYGNSSSKVFIKNCLFYKAADKCIQINSTARVYIKNCHFEGFQRGVRACGTCGNKSYRVYVQDCTAYKGTALLKMTNSKARGEVTGSKVENVRYVAQIDGGAKVKTRGNQSYR